MEEHDFKEEHHLEDGPKVEVFGDKEHHEKHHEHSKTHVEEKHPVHHARHEHSERHASREHKKTVGVGAYAIIGLVVLLLAFSLVQTYQIGQLEEKVSTGGGLSVVGAPASGGASGAAPVARQAAPTMVGGC